MKKNDCWSSSSLALKVQALRVEALKVEALTASLAQSVMQMPPLFLFKPPVLTSEPLLLVAEFSRYVNLVEFTNK